MASVQEIYLVIGVGLLASSFIMFIQTRKFQKNALKTKGVIVRFDYDNGNSSDQQLVAIVEYVVNQKKYTCTSMFFRKKTHNVGKPIDVLYDKAHPYQGRIDSVAQLYFMELILLIIGLSAIFAGVF